ncbi:MAG: 23S rRNA (pseudouridine(1915)-N(3))-methyltransferase RlmH [Gammaproteobacteria bacterium]|nr:23S rRNA (pseudouridine(1915)-N(3))-methyltransferase RlmH [Gammaproteobacteria bacterium]
MRIHFLAVGQRVPGWVEEGYQEFARRLPPECRLQLTEIAAARRVKGADIDRLRAEEGERLLAALPRGACVVALDVRGAAWSTEQLAARLAEWLQGGRDVALMAGGPDGLAPECLRRADVSWSLSPLTLPHALVRIVVAEQIYRAWTVYKGHPYHRA